MATHYWPPVDRSALLWHNMRGGAAMPGENMPTTIEGAGEWIRWALGGGLALAAGLIAWFVKDRAAMHAAEIKRLKEDSEAQIYSALERGAKEREALVAEVERTRQAAAEREAIRRESAEQYLAINRKLEAIQEGIVSGREVVANEVATLRTAVAKLELRCDALEHRTSPRRRTNP